MNRKWQSAWNLKDKDAITHLSYPNVTQKKIPSTCNKSQQSEHIRLISGYNFLKEHMYRIRMADNQWVKWHWDCYAYTCTLPIILISHHIMYNDIDSSFNKSNLPINKRNFNSRSMLLLPQISSQKCITDIKTFVTNLLSNT